MYSILILKSTATYQYYLDPETGEQYKAGTLGDVQEKVAELLKDYTLGRLVVVKNCVITANIVVEEATE